MTGKAIAVVLALVLAAAAWTSGYDLGKSRERGIQAEVVLKLTREAERVAEAQRRTLAEVSSTIKTADQSLNIIRKDLFDAQDFTGTADCSLDAGWMLKLDAIR